MKNRGWFLVAVVCLLAGAGSAQAEGLPLLPPGTHVGLTYTQPILESEAGLDAVFETAIQAGVDIYPLMVTWADLEPQPGQYDVSGLEQQLAIIQASGLRPYLLIGTINANNLTIPADLIDPEDPTRIVGGRHFDYGVLVLRFTLLMDHVAPLLKHYGGFFISVGNEVDSYLRSRPEEVDPFLDFIRWARMRIDFWTPDMGVGASVTFDGIWEDDGVLVRRILEASDAAAFTYYPLNADFSPMDPSVAWDDVQTMQSMAGSLPILIQEAPSPSNGSSLDRQAEFITNLFDAVAASPQVRMLSLLQLADWTSEQWSAFLNGVRSLQTGSSLITNGGFEEGRLDWNRGGTIDQTTAFLGEASVRLRTSSRRGRSLSHSSRTPVLPGDLFRAVVAIKTEDMRGDAYLEVRWVSGPGRLIHAARIGEVKGTQDWQTYSLNLKAPPGAERMRVRLVARRGGGVAHFDAIRVHRLPSLIAPPGDNPPEWSTR